MGGQSCSSAMATRTPAPGPSAEGQAPPPPGHTLGRGGGCTRLGGSPGSLCCHLRGEVTSRVAQGWETTAPSMTGGPEPQSCRQAPAPAGPALPSLTSPSWSTPGRLCQHLCRRVSTPRFLFPFAYWRDCLPATGSLDAQVPTWALGLWLWVCPPV